jgi:glycine cleavage system H protein
MAEPLTFMMGKYAADLPGALLYARIHLWCQPTNDVLRFGFTRYALRLMQDVYFLDWSVGDGTAVSFKQHIGNIETSKATSDLFAPLAGTITTFNQDVLKDPSLINVDCYGVGWLFEMTGDTSALLDAQGYYDFLTATWDQTQRILKGQVGE